MPRSAADDVVAVAQGRDAVDRRTVNIIAAAAHLIIGVVAYKAIAFGYSAADPRAAIGPGHRSVIAVPIRTSDHVIAVVQGVDARKKVKGSNEAVAHLIIGLAPDEASGVGDGAADPRAAVPPGYRSALAVPEQSRNHVIPIVQGGDAVEAHLIIGVAANEGTDEIPS